MVKNNDSKHPMNTRSKNKKKKSHNPKKVIKKETNKITINDDDNDIKDILNLLILLEKFENKKKEYYNSSTSEEESIIEDEESIIEDEETQLLNYYEHQLLTENTDSIPFKHKILKSNLKNEIKKTIIQHINYINTLNEHSSEYQKLSSWLQYLEKIPFDTFINLPVNFNSPKNKICNFLEILQNNLNNCIYGQNKAKESILQITTQIITNPKSKGSIIALKGPPGVGKTSLIKNGLSKALNLPFSFITLGGINDSSYFDGFSYTYEGSKYGKISEILMKSGCMNPIIFMDELDKISNTDKGDEINNLLVHLTDFTQNDYFEDKYFSGIPLDLSKAIFIFSLNDERLLNPILKDRLNIINLEEFKTDEKIQIAINYLIPELKENIGLKDKIIFNKKNIEYIILNYCPLEQGVRELKRCIETILRRINILKYSKKIKLNYSLDKFKFPLEIQNNIIDELLQDKKKKQLTSHLMMYT